VDDPGRHSDADRPSWWIMARPIGSDSAIWVETRQRQAFRCGLLATRRSLGCLTQAPYEAAAAIIASARPVHVRVA
jgi:predicted hotdog family 3-hydroxylacyl-ACP dehydratase